MVGLFRLGWYGHFSANCRHNGERNDVTLSHRTFHATKKVIIVQERCIVILSSGSVYKLVIGDS